MTKMRHLTDGSTCTARMKQCCARAGEFTSTIKAHVNGFMDAILEILHKLELTFAV